MDGQRFDAVTRSLATRQTRRGTLRRLAAATGALIAAGIPGAKQGRIQLRLHRLRLRHRDAPSLQQWARLLRLQPRHAGRRRGLLEPGGLLRGVCWLGRILHRFLQLG